MIAYNAADFIISGFYRKTGGTDGEMGMFERLETLSMPGLFRVTSGVVLGLARHHSVSPRVSEERFVAVGNVERRRNMVAPGGIDREVPYRRAGVGRVRTRLFRSQHAPKVPRLAKTDSIWDQLDVMNRRARDSYSHTLNYTVFRPRAMATLDS